MTGIRLVNSDLFNIESLQAETTEITPDVEKVLSSISNGKISGGIFRDQSIKFTKKQPMQSLSFTPDSEISSIESNPSFISYKGGSNNGGDGGMSDLERRVQNLEAETKKIREQLSEINSQTNTIAAKLDYTVSKSDLFQVQNTITSSQSQAINQLPSLSDIKVIISEEMKNVPTTNDIKSIVNDLITEKKLTTETKVENLLMKQRNSAIKWIVGTGIGIVGLILTYVRFFVSQ